MIMVALREMERWRRRRGAKFYATLVVASVFLCWQPVRAVFRAWRWSLCFFDVLARLLQVLTPVAEVHKKRGFLRSRRATLLLLLSLSTLYGILS